VDGQQTLRYGWAQVKWEACATAVELAKVLRRRGWDGWPRPCSPSCPVRQELQSWPATTAATDITR